MAPSVAWNPGLANSEMLNGPPGVPTPGFHPVIAPFRDAKRKTEGPLFVPSVTVKSFELPLDMIDWNGLNTVPVGFPPGITTSKRWLRALPPRSPKYRGLRPVRLSDSQNAPALGLAEMPQGLTRFGSRSRATPAWSDTRLFCWNRLEADSRARSSSASRASRGRSGFRAVLPLRRPLS